MHGEKDPAKYTSKDAKVRFALAKYFGMGGEKEWTAPEIAEALDCHPQTVYNYVTNTEMAEEVREVLATTRAEWRLDMALQLRREVERLEEIEQELLEKKKTVATGYETKTVEGTPTGDRNISLPDHPDRYKLQMPVPTEFETVTDYGADLERVQKEKRQYLSQISDLLGLDAADRKEVDHTLASRHEEVKIVEYRESDDDDYPEANVVDVDGEVPDDLQETNDVEGSANE
jgi:AcrR family transcriptional regulator